MTPSKPGFVKYLNYGYYVGVIPFRYISKTVENEYTASANPFQTMVCGSVHFLTILRSVVWILNVVQTFRCKVNETNYFRVVQEICSFSYIISFYLIVWSTKWRAKITALIVKSMQYMTYCCRPSIVTKADILCILAILLAILLVILETGITDLSTLNPVCILKAFVYSSKKFWTINHDGGIQLGCGDNETSSSLEVEFGEVVMATFDFITNVSSTLVYLFAQAFVILAALELLSSAKALTAKLNIEQIGFYNVRTNPIIPQWHSLKSLSITTNNVIRHVVFFHWMVAISNLCTNFNEIVENKKWFEVFLYLYFGLTDLALFIVAPEILNEVDKFREFLLDEDLSGRIFTSQMRTEIWTELNENPVGIRGWRKFVIDNSFVANMLITMVTLFSIVLGNGIIK